MTTRRPKKPRSPHQHRVYNLRYRYGLTIAQYDALFAKQKKRCAICESKTAHFRQGWIIDHCHTTKKVRGIVCQPCNLTIGHAKENIERLKRVIRYIRKHQ